MGVENAAQEQKVLEGTMEISCRMVAHLAPAVCLEHIVREIDSTGSGIKVTVQLGRRDGLALQSKSIVLYCDEVIMALAPSLYTSIAWNHPLPPLKSQLSQRMH